MARNRFKINALSQTPMLSKLIEIIYAVGEMTDTIVARPNSAALNNICQSAQ
jgi:hypothetical protein